GYSKEFLAEIGLVDNRRLRPECLIYTVRDGQGRPVAFAARFLEYEEQERKLEVLKKGFGKIDGRLASRVPPWRAIIRRRRASARSRAASSKARVGTSRAMRAAGRSGERSSAAAWMAAVSASGRPAGRGSWEILARP